MKCQHWCGDVHGHLPLGMKRSVNYIGGLLRYSVVILYLRMFNFLKPVEHWIHLLWASTSMDDHSA